MGKKTNNTNYRSAGDSGRDSVMMFGVLITGIFVFMTFRIDRGAQNEARQTSERVAREVVVGIAREAAGKAAEGMVDESRESIANFSSAIVEVLRRWAEESDLEDLADRINRLARTDLELILQAQPPQDTTNLEVDSDSERRVVGEGDSPVWFRFDVMTGGMYRIMTRELSNFDPVIYLYFMQGESLRFLSYDDDSGEGILDSRLEVELTPGAHYIAVRDFDGDGGEFSISVVLDE